MRNGTSSSMLWITLMNYIDYFVEISSGQERLQNYISVCLLKDLLVISLMCYVLEDVIIFFASHLRLSQSAITLCSNGFLVQRAA